MTRYCNSIVYSNAVNYLIILEIGFDQLTWSWGQGSGNRSH